MFQLSDVVPVRRHPGVRANFVRAAALTALIAPLAVGGLLASSGDAEAKGPGRTYCFYKKCHRVKTLAETAALAGQDLTVTASFYDHCKRDRYNPCGLTSSGERFRPDRADNAASPVLPDGTIVLVWSPANGESVVLRINNAGPYWGDRTLDLSAAAARKLGIKGVGKVKMRVLKAPTEAEARYERNRTYDPVPGPIGAYASLDQAHGAVNTMIALGAPGTDALAAATRLIASVDSVVGLATDPRADLATDMASLFKWSVAPGFAGTQSGLAAALAEEQGGAFAVAASAALRDRGTHVARETSNAGRPQSTADVDDVHRGGEGRPQIVPATRAGKSKAYRVSSLGAAQRPNTPKAAAQKRRSTKLADASAKRTLAKAAASRTKRVTSPIEPQPPVAKKKVAQAHPAKMRSQEIDVGFTTYAERRYQTVQRPLVGQGGIKPMRKTVKAKAGNVPPAAVGASSSPLIAHHKPQPEKVGKSAAAKKADGWHSSALRDDLRPRGRQKHRIGSAGLPI